METLGGFPNLPALWLQRAKPAFADASASPHDLQLERDVVRNAG
jgi:hypothetical protein